MFKNLTKKFVKEEKGAPIVELIILIAMSAIIAAFLFPTLRQNLGAWFDDMVKNISQGIGGAKGQGANKAPVASGGGTGGWGKP